MKIHAFAIACFAAFSCAAGAKADASAATPPPAVMGIVPSPVPEEVREHVKLEPTEGIFVKGVAPGSPAETAGLREADIIVAINGTRLLSREKYREVVAGKKAGDVLHLVCLRAGSPVEIPVTLKTREEVVPRSNLALKNGSNGKGQDVAVSRRARALVLDPAHARRQAYIRSVGVQGMRPVELKPEIVAAIREVRGKIIGELSQSSEAVDAARLTRLMQRLRDLAREANANRQNWMVGKAGEATLQFRDDEGTIVLTGANNLIQIELLTPDGHSVYQGPFTTDAERRAVPCDLPARFRALQQR